MLMYWKQAVRLGKGPYDNNLDQWPLKFEEDRLSTRGALYRTALDRTLVG